MKAMIFAAGLGTRLKPLTDTMPKALVSVGGKTLLEWQIEGLKKAGIREMVVNVHHFGEQIMQYLEANHSFGCSIGISDERGCLLETGGGLRYARTMLDGNEPILACNVDILSNLSITALMNAYREDDTALLVVSERETQRYLLFDDNQRLSGWTNVSTGEIRPSDLDATQANGLHRLAFSGMQIVHPRIFKHLEAFAASQGDKFSLIDLYLAIGKKEVLRAYIPENYRMMDVGKISELQEAEIFAKQIIRQ